MQIDGGAGKRMCLLDALSMGEVVAPTADPNGKEACPTATASQVDLRGID
jgi:hypothetical protein